MFVSSAIDAKNVKKFDKSKCRELELVGKLIGEEKIPPKVV